MDHKVSLFGPSLHQALMAFPLGLLAAAVTFDLLHLALDLPYAAVAAYSLLTAGLVVCVAAAPWGWVDWLAIPPGTKAKRIDAMHEACKAGVLLLFAVSWWLRQDPLQPPPFMAYVLSMAGAALSLFTAQLGVEVAEHLADDEAAPDGAGIDFRSAGML